MRIFNTGSFYYIRNYYINFVVHDSNKFPLHVLHVNWLLPLVVVVLAASRRKQEEMLVVLLLVPAAPGSSAASCCLLVEENKYSECNDFIPDTL